MLSPALRPFVQQNLFRSIVIHNLGAWTRLSQVFTKRPELGSYVTSLRVHIPDYMRVEFHQISSQQLLDLFHHTTLLQSLVLANDSPIGSFLLSPRTDTTSFQFLKRLEIVKVGISSTTSLAQHFAHVSQYPNLVELVVKLYEGSYGENSNVVGQEVMGAEASRGGAGDESRGVQGEGAVVVASKGQAGGSNIHARKCISVKTLEIAGPLDHSQMVEFVELFPLLTKVLLATASVSQDYSAILAAINPSTLVSLTTTVADSRRRQPQQPASDLDNANITRFTSLKFLSLHQQTFTPLFFTHVRSLPSLVTLEFEYGTDPSYKELVRLIKQGPPSLKNIELNQLYAERGPSNMDLNMDWEEDGRVVPHPDWNPAYWEDNLHHSQVKKLVVLAEAAGISLGETITGVLEIEKDYREELRLCKRLQRERDADDKADRRLARQRRK